MTTIKSYTDIPQSKKLAEILPLESADMWYSYYGNSKYNPTIAYKGQQWFLCQIRNSLHDDVPCWSLAALLNILAEQDFIIKSSVYNNEYSYNIDIPSRHCKIWFSSLLDAVFEMICWLKENGKI